MISVIWGPYAWKFLEAVVLEYPNCPTVVDKQNMHEFIVVFGRNLPCVKCRDHFKKFIEGNPIVLDSKKDLLIWVIDLHNSVNKELGKPVLTHEDALTKILQKNNHNYKNIIIGILVLIIVFLILFFSSCRINTI